MGAATKCRALDPMPREMAIIPKTFQYRRPWVAKMNNAHPIIA